MVPAATDVSHIDSQPFAVLFRHHCYRSCRCHIFSPCSLPSGKSPGLPGCYVQGIVARRAVDAVHSHPAPSHPSRDVRRLLYRRVAAALFNRVFDVSVSLHGRLDGSLRRDPQLHTDVSYCFGYGVSLPRSNGGSAVVEQVVAGDCHCDERHSRSPAPARPQQLWTLRLKDFLLNVGGMSTHADVTVTDDHALVS